ncbi:hypothetical protein [Brevifollis gellanilyticus]|uniref:Uncharacterized protein n=1 Tax=Brevifollis gellanilyticus TaxID=748831 RepID=A0A512MFB6_9BACT|nr:hypothetical protein [Brevifollis gellanilyticus]GEP45418.1 hypothetical protein BGE01nite_47090 [Brevifollis gellanilyticus]
MKTLLTSLGSTTTRRSALFSTALLAASVFFPGQASADNINVTMPTVPRINSYVPDRVAGGETLLMNHTGDVNLGSMSSLEFKATNGRTLSAPITRLTSTLYRVNVPVGAITGVTTLVSPSGDRRDQPAITIVAPTLRARGISVINLTQFRVDSVKKGATELLPAGQFIPAREARFVTHNFSTEPNIALDVRYVYLPPSPPPGVLTLGEAPVPVLNERILASLPRPTTSGPVTALNTPTRRELELEDLSGFDLMGAVSGAQGHWRIIQGDRKRSMILQGLGNSGTMTLKDTFLSGNSLSRQFNVTFFMAATNPDEISMVVRDPSTNAQVGQTVRIPIPFDVFSTDTLGFFNRTEDDQRDNDFGTQIRGQNPNVSPPLLVRRVILN